MANEMSILELHGTSYTVVDSYAREQIDRIPIKLIESDKSDPVVLRSVETGLYVLKGTFQPYPGATSSISFSNQMLTNISTTSSQTTLQVFYPSTNYVRHMVITDEAFSQTYVYFNKMNESITTLTDTVASLEARVAALEGSESTT